MPRVGSSSGKKERRFHILGLKVGYASSKELKLTQSVVAYLGKVLHENVGHVLKGQRQGQVIRDHLKSVTNVP